MRCVPSRFGTMTIGLLQGELEGLTIPASNMSLIWSSMLDCNASGFFIRSLFNWLAMSCIKCRLQYISLF